VAAKIINRGVAVFYPGTVFESQFQWVSETIEWASRQPEIRVIIRLHPRDLPNKRDSVLSEQHEKWMGLLGSIPPNVIVNHPDQLISFQEVCLVSDVLVTGWSSTAIEAMLLGKPVVTYDQNLPGFPKDIHLTGDSKKEYFENLDASFRQDNLQDHVEVANRWLTHFLVRGSLPLSGGLFAKSRISGPVVIRKMFSGIDRYLPYLWRPLELMATFRSSNEADRINELFRDLHPNLYGK
jgi:CDP-glycerol glycerophosphotransferase (TagB/SpsB family)